MAKQIKVANAGVHAAAGFEFQKYCALHILFENYSTIQGRSYFICIEHHNDVLFCFVDHAKMLESINAYQTKKSSTQWALGADLSDILKKITQVGLDLHADPEPKNSRYSHTLQFITNNSIQMTCGRRPPVETELINESNTEVKYVNLHGEIKANIIKKLKDISVVAANQLAELDNLSLAYIDFPRKAQSQKDNLVGQFKRIFGNRVRDAVAAIDSLLLLFRGVETTLNNHGVSKLMDKSKRIEGDAIASAIHIITSQVKAYELWRDKGDILAGQLNISAWDHKQFELKFQNSFDLFKDLRQAEHQKILKYVLTNKSRWTQTNDVAVITAIYTAYTAENNTRLLPLDLKAAISAAYIELKG